MLKLEGGREDGLLEKVERGKEGGKRQASSAEYITGTTEACFG